MTGRHPLAAALDRFEAAAAEVRALAAAATAPPVTTRSPASAAAVHVDADEWWASLPPDRREQIRRWITQRDRHHEHVDGQLDALDHLTQHDDTEETR